MTEPLVGVINAGSSSLKFSFYDGERRILSGQVDGIGVRPKARAMGPDDQPVAPPDLGERPPATPGDAPDPLDPSLRRCRASVAPNRRGDRLRRPCPR